MPTLWTHGLKPATVLAAVLASACNPQTAAQDGGRQGAADGAAPVFGRFDGDPFGGRPLTGVSAAAQASLDTETVWALAHCDCMPGLAGRFLKDQALRAGALPEILVPDVREQLRNDDRLKQLAQLPALLSPLGGILTGLLASNEKIAAEIRKTTTDRLTRSLAGGTRLAERLAFRFDLFRPLARTAGEGGFDTAEQAARWALVMGLESMWTRAEPLALGDHGLQLFQTAVALTEWKYLFGLPDSPTAPTYGGLVVAARDGVGGKPAALDPRKQPGIAAFVSGTYSLSVAMPAGKDSAVDLAINARETWTRRADPVPLAEQAMILTDAAMAFKRLRPEARARVTGLFAARGGLIPDTAHELPLAFLAVMGPLLQSAFIDADARTIHAVAALPGTSGEARARAASLSGLARLARGLALWVGELADLDAAVPDAAQRDELTAGRENLRKALQLVVQIMLRDHVAAVPGDHGVAWLALVTEPEGGEAGLAEAAEALAVLADVGSGPLDSPFLRERVAGLAHWFAARRLAQLPEATTAGELLWSLTALQATKRALGPEAARIKWLAEASAKIEGAVRASDGAAPAPQLAGGRP